MRLLKIFCVALSFSISMRVNASSSHETASSSHHHEESGATKHGVLNHEEHLEQTLTRREPSPVETVFEVLRLEKSFIENGTLLSGSHWVRNSKSYNLKTPYGDIASRNSDFFVQYEGNKVSVVNNFGQLKVVLKDGGVVDIPPGFEFWFSEIKQDKKNKTGFIQPVDLKKHILVLGKFWTEDQESFKAVMLKIQSRWGDRTGLAAQYYKGLALRKIASVQKEEDRSQSIRRQESNRRAANRKLLYERAFGR
jgi:hypothetical protein